jgi:hypothetical protein
MVEGLPCEVDRCDFRARLRLLVHAYLMYVCGIDDISQATDCNEIWGWVFVETDRKIPKWRVLVDGWSYLYMRASSM